MSLWISEMFFLTRENCITDICNTYPV
uniref:Uncharacterized protein n=1 Tax=Anguilla anguilla TaxID=7936 RepID=A0A0E9Q6T6_ANGAN